MVAMTGCVGRLVMTSINFAKMAQPTEKIIKLCRSDIECKINKEQREYSAVSTLLHFSSSNSFALQRHTDFDHSSRTAEHYTLQTC